MSSYSGPNEVTNGLVFQYDMGNTKKSWLGPPSVNLCLNDSDTLNGTNWYAYCAGNTNNITYNTADIKDPEGNYTATKIVRDSGTVCGATGAWGLIWGLANVTAGVTYTISIWACAPIPMSVYFAMNDAGGGGSINLTSTWQRFTFTSALPTSGTGNRGLQFIMPAGSGTAYFWGAQLEEMSFMTPYMSTTKNQGSRTNTTAIKDLTSNTVLTVNSPTYYSDGSFGFAGTTQRIDSNIITFGNNATWEAMIYCTNGTATTYNMFMGRYLPYFSFYGGNRLYFSNNIGGTQRTIQTATNLSANTWYHAAFTTSYDGVNTIMKIYTNGSETSTGTFLGSQNDAYGSPFVVGDGTNYNWYRFEGKVPVVKIYNRTLTASEVLQNFNSLRGRFGL